jgi:hypothetical protein
LAKIILWERGFKILQMNSKAPSQGEIITKEENALKLKKIAFYITIRPISIKL